jgi:hypothetical protein
MAKKAVPEQQLPLAPYRNQQLFSDYYLANTLPQRADWQALAVQAQPVMAKIAAIFNNLWQGAPAFMHREELPRAEYSIPAPSFFS